MLPDEYAIRGQVVIVPLDNGRGYRVDSIVHKTVNGRIVEFRNSMGEVDTYEKADEIRQTWFGRD